MTLTTTEYKHIQLNENNVPMIAGTSLKVVELMTTIKAYQWTPEELHENYPHVSMSKIYAALSYYWDHQEEIDEQIEKHDPFVKKIRQEVAKSPNDNPLTPAQKADNWLKWVKSHTSNNPPLPDSALHRDTMYD